MPRLSFQGIEDSFGFSWGFPPLKASFPSPAFTNSSKARPLTDSLCKTPSASSGNCGHIGFGVNEDPSFRREFSKRGNTLQLSSTVYWYQLEPHAPLPHVPAAAERAPAPEQAFWPDKEAIPTGEELRARGVKVEFLCGRPEKELIFAEPGYAAAAKRGYAYNGWGLPIYHCRADNERVEVELTVPKRAAGKLRVFMIDPDNFEGGRTQRVSASGVGLGKVEQFAEGRWLEQRLNSEQTSTGNVVVTAVNARSGANAVLSIVEWVEERD